MKLANIDQYIRSIELQRETKEILYNCVNLKGFYVMEDGNFVYFLEQLIVEKTPK